MAPTTEDQFWQTLRKLIDPARGADIVALARIVGPLSTCGGRLHAASRLTHGGAHAEPIATRRDGGKPSARRHGTGGADHQSAGGAAAHRPDKAPTGMVTAAAGWRPSARANGHGRGPSRRCARGASTSSRSPPARAASASPPPRSIWPLALARARPCRRPARRRHLRPVPAAHAGRHRAGPKSDGKTLLPMGRTAAEGHVDRLPGEPRRRR